MIRTYEVHDLDSENDDEMVEFDPQVVENLNWWQRCFIPKYPDTVRGNVEGALSNETESQQKGQRDETIEERRCRFHSEDVTVSTNLTTPPGTPNVTKVSSVSSSSQSVSNKTTSSNTSKTPSKSNDVETPLIRKAISAIDEEPEEAERASEEGRATSSS
ncbi:unnamed protein product [Pseudo-nitzschia multistriata]|uniref:Uncharacterized protein n=1 Tax=Pseudo-nitzschia multistriata TaxID=183589 RepID=A0A448ZET0_9STRA|nr:unnamed protein product [Pseudo-nitzschia multistriata]